MPTILPNFQLFGDLNPCEGDIVSFINQNFEKIDFTKAYSVERVATLPGTAVTGDKVLLITNNNLYYWTDSWQEVISRSGMAAYDETNSVYIFFDGANWNEVGGNVTGDNVGSGSEVFKQKTGNNLELRTLVEGSNITLTQTADEIEISSLNVPADGSVTTAKIADDAVTTAKIADDAVTGAKLGVGAGNITESGSDTNGRYIKFEDGTMLQWGEVETTESINVARGSLFIRYGSTITFPEEFNSVPEFFVNYKSNSGSVDDRLFWATGATPTTTTCPTCLWSPTSVGSATHVISWNAVGRWK